MHPRVEALTNEPVTTRRGVLKAVVGGGAVLGGAKALDNVVLGYGVVSGTNLKSQSLGPIADEHFRVFPTTVTMEEYVLEATHQGVTIETATGESLHWFPSSDGPITDAHEVDDSLGLNGVLVELVSDLVAIERGTHVFEFHRLGAFFDRLMETTPRPYSTTAVRGWPGTEPALVEEFTRAPPSDPRATTTALVHGFRDHTYYDVPRYAAGSIQDNVIFGAADLRAPFRSATDFETLLNQDGTGLFCYEFTHRSIEALHATAPPDQQYPIVAARVWDQRHKHVYTAIASVVRDDETLAIPMTFVDYTHTTLYDDLHLRGVLGEGLEAYDDRHRASVIHWRP